ncbi:glycosyltransferase family 2 protein [Pseudarthrobacter sp. C1]|uniref:glycosyltransferase family 2 protein n=1 Tax=Pseudarthrobacter sp. C1 TaxID=3108940 RepID=UPI002B05193F|nr:glycosyltransferase family 2 protein [Pseudarthrobacter sp. C1]MEA3550261.1 glycosyltransferase family 2 protein [Pseudarthrobacter sp. C1]
MNYFRGNIAYVDLRGYVGHYSNSARRSIKKTVARNFVFPSNFKSLRSESVWGISMVRDEEDVIEEVIRHQLGQGISPILIADNNSVDSTPRILARLAEELPVFIVQDSLRAYHQDEKMTALSRAAFDHGAKWIVPFDADEMWFAEESTVADFLTNSDLSIVRAAMYNIYPTGAKSIGSMDLSEQPMAKVAFRASRFALLGIGNHRVVRSGKLGTGLYVAHYPWRNVEQLQRKVRQGREALEAAALAGNMGSHWRALADLTDRDVQRLWSFIETQTPHPVLEDKFLGPFVDVDPRHWSTWQGPRADQQDAGSKHA